MATFRRPLADPSWWRLPSGNGPACSRWSRQSETVSCQNRRHESVASRIFLARGIDRARDLLPAQQPQLVDLVARRSGLAADIDRARLVAHPPPSPNLRETRGRDEDQVPQLLLARGSH